MWNLLASWAANRACHAGMQIRGGHGVDLEEPLERYAREERMTSIYEGTSEIQRMIISRGLLAS